MSVLRKRECLFTAEQCRENPKLRGFYKKQRDALARPGMVVGEIPARPGVGHETPRRDEAA